MGSGASIPSRTSIGATCNRRRRNRISRPYILWSLRTQVQGAQAVWVRFSISSRASE